MRAVKKSIILLGASGYIGQAFSRELEKRALPFIPVSRKNIDYTILSTLVDYIQEVKPVFLINAAGYTGKPNVDACEVKKAETITGNISLVQTIADACEMTGLPWTHISSGCIYSGAKIVENGQTRIEKDLLVDSVRSLVEQSPSVVRGFSEADAPNFSFAEGPCSFYSGTKALAEEVVARYTNKPYVLRPRIPFDEYDTPRNYLSKLQNYPKVYENFNSLSHLGDFVNAALDLWQTGAPSGVYNVTNPGFVTTKQVVKLIQKIRKIDRGFDFWKGDAEFYTVVKTPRSNCILDVSKLLSTSAKMRPVEEALESALTEWR